MCMYIYIYIFLFIVISLMGAEDNLLSFNGVCGRRGRRVTARRSGTGASRLPLAANQNENRDTVKDH